MRAALLCCIVSMLLLLAGCSGPDLEAPPQVRFGHDVCDECRMILSEPRYAAAFFDSDGAARRFDDVGDLLIYLHKGKAPELAWVKDYHTEEWLKASEAFYARCPELITPMGHGVVAFASRSQAEQLAAERNGKVLDWISLQAISLEELEADTVRKETH